MSCSTLPTAFTGCSMCVNGIPRPIMDAIMDAVMNGGSVLLSMAGSNLVLADVLQLGPRAACTTTRQPLLGEGLRPDSTRRLDSPRSRWLRCRLKVGSAATWPRGAAPPSAVGGGCHSRGKEQCGGSLAI